MRREVILAGFAIFAMFFGSGNIVFPLTVGRISGDAWLFAMLGFFITAVFVPLMGLVAVVLLEGSSSRFFGLIGKIPGNIVQFFIIALIGPFGVIPRCITVSYGAFKTLEFGLPAIAFFAIFCVCIWFLTMRREHIIPIIGKFLTPIKFGLICLLIIVGIYTAPAISPHNCIPLERFTHGISEGYQTMDLTAAIFFSAAIMTFFRKVEGNSRRALLRDGIQASFIGATLLTGVYAAFMYLGTSYADLTCHIPPEEILPFIAHHALGSKAGMAFCITIAFSCLTTAVALTTCWLDTLKNMKILPALSYRQHLLLMLGITFGMASLGFSGLVKILFPILQVIYPLIIVMVIIHIVRELRNQPNSSPKKAP